MVIQLVAMLGVTTLPVFSDSGNDNSCVASGNSNSSNVNKCKNDKNNAIDNASSSDGNNIVVSLVILPVIQFLMIMFPPTLMTTEMDESNVNDNMGNLKNDNDCAITWDDVVAIEDAARDLEEVPARSDRLQQSYIPRRLTRASTKSKS